ncbi:MAG: hypothetical protein U0Y82_09740 [Thermoleophilia bacterium]
MSGRCTSPPRILALRVLAANPGRVLPHATIVRRAWDEAAGAVANLRVVVDSCAARSSTTPTAPASS